MADGSRWAGLRTETAVHALANIDVELAKGSLLGLFIHIDPYGNTGDGAEPLAGKATRTDIQVHLQNAPISKGQGVLDLHGHAVWILDRHGTAHKVGEGDGQPLEDRGDCLRDIIDVLGQCVH